MTNDYVIRAEHVRDSAAMMLDYLAGTDAEFCDALVALGLPEDEHERTMNFVSNYLSALERGIVSSMETREDFDVSGVLWWDGFSTGLATARRAATDAEGDAAADE